MELRVEGLTISRGDLVLAREVAAVVGAGGALVVRGPNGSGKSTLLRALLGLVVPDAGTVALTHAGEGLPVAENAHYVGHDNALKAELTVRENLLFWAGFLGDDAGADGPEASGGGPEAGGGEEAPEAIIEEAAGLLGLEDLLDLPAGYLSAGQRRRVALARPWVAPRPLWLLDEPTAALDARSEGAVRDMIEAHREEGGIVVAVTHRELGLAAAQSLELGVPAHG